MPRLLPGLVALALAAAPALTDEDTVPRHMKLLQEAHARSEWPAMLRHAEAVLRLAPRSTRAQYNLACALARNGRAQEAVATLDRLAGRGVSFDVAGDEDLASLRDLPTFRAVAAKFADLRRPLGHAQEAFRLPEKDLLAEGLTYDPGSRHFFVGSVHRGRIVRVGPDGTSRDFAAVPDAVLGMAVDPPRQRLWACTTAVPERAGFDPANENRAALVAFDLVDGREVARLPLRGAGRPDCNDVTVAADGSVFVSDARAGTVRTAAAGARELRVLVPAGRLASPQGLALSADGKVLYVADYPAGVARVDVATGEAALLSAPDDAVVGGIDGLVRHGRVLVGIQNGIRPHRVVALELGAGGITKVEVLLRGHEAFDEPTLGVVVGRDLFFVANSQWESFGGGKVAAEKLREPVVLRLGLP